jgi:hypothetical protein
MDQTALANSPPMRYLEIKEVDTVARYIVYERKEEARPVKALVGGAPAAPPKITADNYASKMVKYVPAEVTAFFVMAAALGHSNQTFLIVALVLGFVFTPVYLLLSSVSAAQKPLLHFYVLAAIAFVPWALVTSPDLASLFGASSAVVAFILAAAVFVIPGADSLLEAAANGKLHGMFTERRKVPAG